MEAVFGPGAGVGNAARVLDRGEGGLGADGLVKEKLRRMEAKAGKGRETHLVAENRVVVFIVAERELGLGLEWGVESH